MTTQIVYVKDLFDKDPREMTIHELLSSMANICLPESNLTHSLRAQMFICLILEADRRDKGNNT